MPAKKDRVEELLRYLECRIDDVRESREGTRETRWMEERRLLAMKQGALSMLAAIITEKRHNAKAEGRG